MSWIYLIIAGLFEVLWATTMKLSNGFENILYSTITIFGMIISFLFLAISVKELSLSIAYPVWTGVGAVGSILVGILYFNDHLSLPTLCFVFLLIISIIGIKLTS